MDDYLSYSSSSCNDDISISSEDNDILITSNDDKSIISKIHDSKIYKVNDSKVGEGMGNFINCDLDSPSIDLSMFKVPVHIKKNRHGLGIYFDRPIKAGTTVVCLCCQNCCRLENHVKISEINKFMNTYIHFNQAVSHAIQVDDDHICLEWNEVLSGHGDLGINYINHSCDPSTWFQINFNTNYQTDHQTDHQTDYQIDHQNDSFILETKRDINVGEELTFDYGTVEYDHSGIENLLLNMNCHCNTVNCRKKILYTDYLLPEIQQRYHNHFSPFIQKKYQKMKFFK